MQSLIIFFTEVIERSVDYQSCAKMLIAQWCMQAVKLRAGFALAVFAFSNTPQQCAIRQAGGLSLSCFETFLDSGDEIERATAAFQVTRYSICAYSICFVRRSAYPSGVPNPITPSENMLLAWRCSRKL